MNFENDAQKQSWERIKPMAEGLFGVFTHFRDDHPTFVVRHGSAVVFSTVAAWSDSALLVSTAYVARGATIDTDLYQYVVNRNEDFVFGNCGIDSDGDVYFRHVVLAPTIDPDELKHTVLAVAAGADQIDDEIVSRWGGKRGDE